MINVIVKPDAIELPAGAVVRVPGTWQDYQALLEHLGDRTKSLARDQLYPSNIKPDNWQMHQINSVGDTLK
jgi:hypothetical protein